MHETSVQIACPVARKHPLQLWVTERVGDVSFLGLVARRFETPFGILLHEICLANSTNVAERQHPCCRLTTQVIGSRHFGRVDRSGKRSKAVGVWSAG